MSSAKKERGSERLPLVVYVVQPNRADRVLAYSQACRCASGTEPGRQPKTGRLQLSRLLCISPSTGRTRNSCEPAPAHYTSMRPSANQRETAWAMRRHQTNSRAGAARRVAREGQEHRSGTSAYQVGCNRQPMVQRNELPEASRPPASVDCRPQAAAVDQHTLCSSLGAASMRSGKAATALIAQGDQGPDGL